MARSSHNNNNIVCDNGQSVRLPFAIRTHGHVRGAEYVRLVERG